MRTLLFCTAWGESTEAMANRLGRWVEHHSALPYPCPVVLAAIGDGIDEEIEWPPGDYIRHNLMPHLGRPSHLEYPGWWRSFSHAATVALESGCERVWHVESDFFLASQRMLNRMNEIEQGWIAFWCHRHGFPETAVQVVGAEHFGTMAGLWGRHEDFIGKHAEHVLPLTTIICDMVGDRYGETAVDPATIAGLDFYGQCPSTIRVPFRSS
jgi:hypothetical protein